MTEPATKVSMYDAAQINALIDQINQSNQTLTDAVNESRAQLTEVVQWVQAALSPVGTGDHAENTLALARSFSVLSQRVALLEARRGTKNSQRVVLPRTLAAT